MIDHDSRDALDGCTFEYVAARTPLVRHGRVVLSDHRIVCGGKQLYVAPAVRLNGATVQANWTPTAAEALDMLREGA